LDTVKKEENEKDSVRAIAVCAILIRILAKNIVESTVWSNSICEVLREGFRAKNNTVKKENQRAWRALIDAYTADPSWSSDDQPASAVGPRLDLVLKGVRQTKADSHIALSLYDTWWHLWVSLGKRLPLVFDDVVHCALRFCVGGPMTYLKETIMKEIKEKVRQPMTPSSSLLSYSSAHLEQIRYCQLTLPRVELLVPKLGLLLEKVVDFRPESFTSEHAKTIFSRAIQIQTIFLVQCIRYYSIRTESSAKLAKQLATMWCGVAKLIKSFIAVHESDKHLKIFFIQLQAWIRETQHDFSIVSHVLHELVSNKHYDFNTKLPSFLCDHVLSAYIRGKTLKPLPKTDE
jgi:hypothetical protein